jgi:hypothetical protein
LNGRYATLAAFHRGSCGDTITGALIRVAFKLRRCHETSR